MTYQVYQNFHSVSCKRRNSNVNLCDHSPRIHVKVYIIRFIQVDSNLNVQGLRYLSTKLCSMKNNFHVQYLLYLIDSSSSQKPAFLKQKLEHSESFSGTEKNYLNPYVVIGKR